MKRAWFLVLPDVHMLDLAGPLQIVSTLPELDIAQVSIHCIGPSRALQSFQNVGLQHIDPLPPRLEKGDVLFVIGSKLSPALQGSPAWRETVDWLRAQRPMIDRGIPLCGICTGAFLLAEAGLLDGRVCTTHYRFLNTLRQGYEDAHVVDNRTFARDGDVWTSAGVTAGIDLTLHLIASQLGESAAIRVGRENVVSFRQFGNDPELGSRFLLRAHGNQLVHEIQDEIERDLSSDARCQDLLAGFGLSYRQISRLFLRELGISIKQYQMRLRIERARQLVLESDMSIEEVADRCGFNSVQGLRAGWKTFDLPSPTQMRAGVRMRA